jgi:hypothetical protein
MGFIVVVVVLLAFFLLRRRAAPAPAYAMAGGYPMTEAPGPGEPPASLQMSPDGNYWWDGQTWRDAAHEAPPWAQRSSDGIYWWDGSNWRPVPPAPQPPA